jgi:hypothetical protein
MILLQKFLILRTFLHIFVFLAIFVILSTTRAGPFASTLTLRGPPRFFVATDTVSNISIVAVSNVDATVETFQI